MRRQLFIFSSLVTTIFGLDAECTVDVNDPEFTVCRGLDSAMVELFGLDLENNYPDLTNLRLVADRENDSPSSNPNLNAESRLVDVLKKQLSLNTLSLVGFNGLLSNAIIRAPPNLERLQIVKAELDTLPADLLKNTELTDLFIKSCTLDTINPDAFHRTGKIEKLKIENCNIREITPSTFLPLKDSLVYLSLAENDIQTVDPTFLKYLKMLKVLNLERSGVKGFPDDFLKYNRELRVVNFSGNDIESLPCGFFRNNPYLKAGNFTYNKLKKIPCDIIKRQGQHLTELDLGNNEDLGTRWNRDMSHKRGVLWRFNKKALRAEVATRAGSTLEEMCNECENHLPPAKKLKLKWDEVNSEDDNENNNGM